MSTSMVGQKLGKYELTELLGQGGMSTVYKGYQRDVDRFVAVKVLPPSMGLDTRFVERFRLEARTIARLQHPHILPLYDYGDENNVLYLVMAFADGGSLNDRVRRGALPSPEITRVFRQVAEALDYAHRQNVVHRDIKPDNILLNREGYVLLADFGIVKILEGSGSATLTGAGGLVGTPAYMSPEQAQGLPVDHHTDIYSLGIVIYEMLTGRQPFSADTPMQLVMKHMTAPVPPLAEFNRTIPPELDAVMQRALAKNPEQRYHSAGDFYADFERALGGYQPLVPPARTPINTPISTPIGAPTDSPTVTDVGMMQTPTQSAQFQPTLITNPSWNPLILLGGFAIIAVLVVAVVYILTNFNRDETGVTTAPTATSAEQVVAPIVVTTAPTYGRVSFTTSDSLGDTANVRVTGLTQPVAGESYYLWLYNTRRDDALKLGSVRVDALGDGQLTYHDESGTMLPMRYNAVLITQQGQDSDTPDGRVVYSGGVPVEIMGALAEILIASPDGIGGDEPTETATAEMEMDHGDDATEEYLPLEMTTSSLIAGAIEEASIARMHAGLAAGSTSPGSLHTHAEHTINILRGTQDDFNGNGRGENPGRGYGVPYFLDRIESQLDEVANAPTANRSIQSQIELIRVCIVNTRGWMNQVIGLESQFFPVEDLSTIQQQLSDSTHYAEAMISGIDLNQNGRVEPFEGECGLEGITTFGVSVGNIDIFAGALPEGE